MNKPIAKRVLELDLPRPEKFVLLAMVCHAWADGSHSKPGLDRIALVTGYSKRHVRRHVGELQEKGLLVETAPAKRHQPKTYSVVPGAWKDLAFPGETFTEPEETVIEEGETFTEPGGTFDENGGDVGRTFEDSREDSIVSSEGKQALKKNYKPFPSEDGGEGETFTKNAPDPVEIVSAEMETFTETETVTEPERSPTQPKPTAPQESSGLGEAVRKVVGGFEAEVAELWAFWVALRKPAIEKITPSQARMIVKGLKDEFAVDDLKYAMVGLVNSRWHNQRDRVIISAIFKTKPGGDSLADQIGRFVAEGKRAGGIGNPSDADERVVLDKQKAVLAAWQMPGHPQAQELGKEAEEWLTKHGWKVVRQEQEGQTGPPRFERQ